MACPTQTPLDEMLSRGIDPDVADPSKCHSHPEVPKRWPSRPELQVWTPPQGDTSSRAFNRDNLNAPTLSCLGCYVEPSWEP